MVHPWGGCLRLHDAHSRDYPPIGYYRYAALCRVSAAAWRFCLLWLVVGRGIFGLMTLIREITYGLDVIVRSHLAEQHRQLGDVARYPPSFIKRQRFAHKGVIGILA